MNIASNEHRPRLGGHILADALVGHVLDGLYQRQSQARFIICRQEGGAAFMADAYGKLTGKPGILMVTRGPGATNAAIGIHTAHQDSTPMIVLVGQVGNDFTDREAFQEVDYRRMFGQMTKWVAQIDSAARVPEYLAHAFQLASSGRMGPVVLALPEDMLRQSASVADAPAYRPVQASASAQQMLELRERLTGAKRPIVILGGSGWTQAACADLMHFAQVNRLPVSCAFRFQDLFDNHDPHYVGDVGIGINPKLAARIRASDLVLAIGPRLGEITTSGYTLFEVPVPAQPLIHVHSGIDELGRVYQPAMMINSGMAQFARSLLELRVDSSAWGPDTAAARADYEAWQQPPAVSAQLGQTIDPWAIVQTLQSNTPKNTIITNGAGNFATWAHRFWRYGGLRTQLAPTSGAMGAGVPAAVAAKIAAPDRCVICFAGDGDFLMTGQELATAAQYRAGIIVIVFNNGMYGTIRMHQEREYPGRVVGTELHNPDFARYAQAFGGFGVQVHRTEEFAPALQSALRFSHDQRLPALIELRLDPQALTPGQSLDQIRAQALKKD
jgi:acetolactate synthase I/II/III large subunit